MTLEEKLKRAIFHHENYFVMEMPADADFLYHEGVAMQHCLQYCHRDYAERIRSGSQRQFSLVERDTGKPCVDMELSIRHSSYSGPVDSPVITQIRGVRNQCPPDDRYLPAIIKFLRHMCFQYTNHGVRNFDGQLDGELVFDRYAEFVERLYFQIERELASAKVRILRLEKAGDALASAAAIWREAKEAKP